MSMNTTEMRKLANSTYVKSLFWTCTQFLHFAYLKNTSVFSRGIPWLSGWLIEMASTPTKFVIHELSIVTGQQLDSVQRSLALMTVKLQKSSWCRYMLQFIHAQLLLSHIRTTLLVTDS